MNIFSSIKLSFFACTAICLLTANTSFAQTKHKHHEPIEQAKWLLGQWQNITPRGIMVENWHQVNDSTYAGKSYFLAGKDTLQAESISLQQRNGKLYYVPTVKNQNNGQPVKFTQLLNQTFLVFENPEHDFPQKISYVQVKPDSLLAEISGMSKGMFRKQGFPMKRVTK